MASATRGFVSGLHDIFSQKKVVENHFLNYAGAQVARMLLASLAHTSRGLAPKARANVHTRALLRDGYMTIPGFLEPSLFQQVKAEFARASEIGQHKPIVDGDTRCERYALSRENWSSLSATNRFLTDPRLSSLLETAERNSVEINTVWFDVITNGDNAKGQDSQKELHEDVYFNTHKAWLFLEPVTLEDGPLCFVRGTNRISLRRLAFEYYKSINFDKLADYSFRVDPFDRKFLGVREEPITVPENTLVIANTRGFHRRGEALPGRTRKQIHFAIRGNPFVWSWGDAVVGREYRN